MNVTSRTFDIDMIGWGTRNPIAGPRILTILQKLSKCPGDIRKLERRISVLVVGESREIGSDAAFAGPVLTRVVALAECICKSFVYLQIE